MARPRKYETDALLDAALEIILEEGVSAATVENLSARTGAPNGTLYSRFGSRDGIAEAAWKRAVKRSQQLFLDAALKQPAREAAVAAALSTLEFATSHPQDARLLVTVRRRDLFRAEAPSSKDGARTSDGAPERMSPTATLEDAGINAPIRAAVETLAGELFGSADPEAVATVALATIDLPHGAIRRYLSAGRPIPDGLADQLQRAVIAVLGPTPGRPGALMVAELDLHDPAGLAEYGSAVIPMLESWGGEVLALSPPGAETIEGEPADRALILHSWPSAARFREFYDSPEYQPLKALRHRVATSRLTAFDTLPAGWRP